MDTIRLPPDFREFLKLLNAHGVEYLLVGGYAVIYHGYPRATGDIDVWFAVNRDNAKRLVAALGEFGFADPSLTVDDLVSQKRILRMGVPPFRIEVLSHISGVEFADCYTRAESAVIDGVNVDVISRDDLIANKRAAGRLKDLGDIENLP